MKKHILLPLFIFSLLINFPIKSKDMYESDYRYFPRFSESESSIYDYTHEHNWLSSGIAAASFIDIKGSLESAYKDKNDIKKNSRYCLAIIRAVIAYDIIVSILDSDKKNEIIPPEFLAAVGAYLLVKSADIAIDRYY